MDELIKNLTSGDGVIVGLVLILVAGRMRVWVWGYIHDEIVKGLKEQLAKSELERDSYRDEIQEERHLAKRAIESVPPTKAAHQMRPN